MTSAAIRIRPTDFFTADQWRQLSHRSSWRGLALVAHAWAVIGLAMVVGYMVPWLIPVCIMVVGTRQLGLAILMHDAAHGLLHPAKRVNDRVGEYLCTPGLAAYRAYHLQHHRLAQQSKDPDLVLSAPFPVTRASLRRKIMRDLTGRTFLKQRFGRLTAAIRRRSWGDAGRDIKRMRRYLLTNLAFFAVFALAGYWWVWVTMWLVPQMCWLPLVTRLRNIAEHALIAENEPDPRRVARTTPTNVVGRALIAPYYVNYHCEHHLFMGFPCWNLPRAHQMLKDNGRIGELLVADGYRGVLAAASNR